MWIVQWLMMSYGGKIPMVLKALVVWWGGSGGSTHGWGGWGWEFSYNSWLSISPWAYSVTIWAWWSQVTWGTVQWNNGWSSIFDTITAIWGGWGWAYPWSNPVGSSWASWWWGWVPNTVMTVSGGTGTAWNNWGTWQRLWTWWWGGAWSAWVAWSWNNWGNGGAWLSSSISWSSVYYAWGWGWEWWSVAGTGGTWWGGNGSVITSGWSAWAANTWWWWWWGGTYWFAWWSWIVILSYATDWSDWISPSSTGGTITTNGGQTVHTFTSDGTFTAIAF